jgi:hypothetical protein
MSYDGSSGRPNASAKPGKQPPRGRSPTSATGKWRPRWMSILLQTSIFFRKLVYMRRVLSCVGPDAKMEVYVPEAVVSARSGKCQTRKASSRCLHP